MWALSQSSSLFNKWCLLHTDVCVPLKKEISTDKQRLSHLREQTSVASDVSWQIKVVTLTFTNHHHILYKEPRIIRQCGQCLFTCHWLLDRMQVEATSIPRADDLQLDDEMKNVLLFEDAPCDQADLWHTQRERLFKGPISATKRSPVWFYNNQRGRPRDGKNRTRSKEMWERSTWR